MELNVYSVRDVVADRVIGIGFAETDGAFMRDGLARFFQVRRLEELEYYQVGAIDNVTSLMKPVPKRLCSMEAYKFPEVQSRELSAAEVEKLAASLAAKQNK